jgi:type-F conjugative transfer system pilin assembly protein TrbC
MLYLIIFWLLGAMQNCLATEASLTQDSLQAIQKQAQQEALKDKEEVSRLQTQAQETEREGEGEGRCYAFRPCFKSKGSKTQNSKGQGSKTQGSKTPQGSPLLTDKAPIVFVSSNMPLESLKALAYQAQKHQAKLVIRGMVKGSFQATAELVRIIGYPLDIDPKLFQTYAIQKVPVFLVYHHDQWHQIQGNVDLAFALEKAKGSSSSQVQEQP